MIVRQSLPRAAEGVIVALLFPTIVSGEATEMLAEAAARVPLMTTTMLEFFLARVTPVWTLHTGAWAVPVLLSLQSAVPSVPT